MIDYDYFKISDYIFGGESVENLKKNPIMENPDIEYQINVDKPFVFLFIGPSGSGKDTITDQLKLDTQFEVIQTATTRKRRVGENEPEDAYVFMRDKLSSEIQTEYYNNLIREYDLIEYDLHIGNLYGVPRRSLYKIKENGKHAISDLESAGAHTLKLTLANDFNVIVFSVVPEKLSDIIDVASKRENKNERIVHSINEIVKGKTIADYYVYNYRDNKNSNQFYGLSKVVESVKNTVKSIVSL